MSNATEDARKRLTAMAGDPDMVLITFHLDDELPSAQREVFDERMKTDPAFRERAERMMWLESLPDRARPSQVDAEWVEWLGDMASDLEQPLESRETVRPAHARWLRAASIAAIALGPGIGIGVAIERYGAAVQQVAVSGPTRDTTHVAPAVAPRAAHPVANTGPRPKSPATGRALAAAPVVPTLPSVRVAGTGAEIVRVPAPSSMGICGVAVPRNRLAQMNADTVSLRPDLAGDDDRSILGRVFDGSGVVRSTGGRAASARTDRMLPPRLPIIAAGASDKPDTTKRTAATNAAATANPLYVSRVCDSIAAAARKP